MTRRSRAAAAAAASRNSTSHNNNETPDHQLDNPPPRRLVSPLSLNGDGEPTDLPLNEEDEDDGSNDRATSANDSDAPSQPTTPAKGHSSLPLKRRAGRPPRGRSRVPAGRDDSESRDAGSDAPTPRRRGGGRGRGFGGGRWAKYRGGPSHTTQVPVDKEGNLANVKDDEIELPEDPEGELKVDKNGTLLGDREYKVRVFSISGKGDRLYMLSTEPARCIGFRDSYLFFQKHKTLWKIILTEEAKRDLINRALIPHSYKGRAIGVVTARSVFREFGARIVIGGRKVIDDYQTAAARANGDVEGELAVPDDQLPAVGEGYDKNRFVAWHGASAVYHAAGPNVPLPNGKAVDGKKRKVAVTGSNWMLEHAREASRFNSSISSVRQQNLAGAYDPHTNVLQYPRIMQATHACWEALPASSDSISQKSAHADAQVGLGFSEVSSILERNFLVADTYFQGPPGSNFGIPGPDGHILDIGPPGLSAIDDQAADTLPADCQRALQSARDQAFMWKQAWGGESRDGARAQLRISYNTPA
ncbi:MAG: hypothetical protein Q9174_000543 [Haloplaca sp. 1 TL-2023]